MTDVVMEARGLERRFNEGGRTLEILRGVDVAVRADEMVAVLGRSGSGKSTLLHLLGGLDRPNAGEVVVGGQRLSGLSPRKAARLRAERIGFVFQFYHLLPELSALENVLCAAMIRRSIVGWLGHRAEARARATALLERVGLAERLSHKPAKLSGGERQRVAIARALMNAPDVLLADEPTGNLDADTGQSVLEMFQQLHADGQAMVLVTHDQRVADGSTRVLTLERGRIV